MGIGNFFTFCEKVPCSIINATGLFTTSYYFWRLRNIGASQQKIAYSACYKISKGIWELDDTFKHFQGVRNLS